MGHVGWPVLHSKTVIFSFCLFGKTNKSGCAHEILIGIQSQRDFSMTVQVLSSNDIKKICIARTYFHTH